MDPVTQRVLLVDPRGHRHTCFTASTSQQELEEWAQQAAQDNPDHIYFFEETDD